MTTSMNTCMSQFRFLVLCFVTLSVSGISAAQTSASDKNPKAEVMYYEAAKVNASFEKGSPLFEGTQDGHYTVLTARRDKPGQAELHAKFTDVIYVVEGTATFVTGGEVIEGKTTAPDEIRGASIKDGTSRKLAKGDVIVIPNGTPHQFVEVNPPFLYLVVKVR